MIKIFFTAMLLMNMIAIKSVAQDSYHEKYRPQAHFSPKEKWVNDPKWNGVL